MNSDLNFSTVLAGLNSNLLLINPLLGEWQNTPRGGVFLSDEYPELVKSLESRQLSDFERGYLLKRTGNLSEAIDAFRDLDSEEAAIQLGFCAVAVGDLARLQEAVSRINSETFQFYFRARLVEMMREVGAEVIYERSLKSDHENYHAAEAGARLSDDPKTLRGIYERYGESSKSLAAAVGHSFYRNGLFKDSVICSRAAISRRMNEWLVFGYCVVR